MEAVSHGVEDDSACPDGLQLLHNQGMRKELLRLGADSNLQRRDTRMLWSLATPGWTTWGRLEPLQRIVIVAERIDQLSCRELLQQAHSQQLTKERTRLTDAHISWVCLPFFPELQAICNQAVQGATVVVLGADLLLDGLDEELGDLRRAQLVPTKRRLAALNDGCPYGVGVVVYGNAV